MAGDAGQSLPKRFQRSVATRVFCDEIGYTAGKLTGTLILGVCQIPKDRNKPILKLVERGVFQVLREVLLNFQL